VEGDFVADQDDILREIILDLVPADGTNIGNQALLTLLQDRIPTITEDAYQMARDALVEEGILGKGRGGSVHRVVGDGDADDDDFALEETEEDLTSRQPGQATRRRRASGPSQVISYRHDDKRLNNPEVGLVHPENDPDAGKTRWGYDPHIDPALMFDSARARIETLIDDALASGDAETMREALAELKRLQAPYLNWTGKAERTSFEIDTVSLHVHERIDPSSILRAVKKRMEGAGGFAEAEQMELFQPAFPDPPLRQALDFYAHEKGWANRLIAGDSLLVMNSLIQKESMAGRVQMIYIDPPYGIKYGSNFQPFVNKRDVKDRSDEDLTAEPEMIKAFRERLIPLTQVRLYVVGVVHRIGLRFCGDCLA
jgi:adenine-specific DNA-methyltransferase